MTTPFKRIGIFVKHNSTDVLHTLVKLISFLTKRGHILKIEQNSAALLDNKKDVELVSRDELGVDTDLVIVIGGDGSFLNAARVVVPHQVPMLGINRGRLGFLADVLPDSLEENLSAILEGHYIEEHRTLLTATINRENKKMAESTALNDIVLYSGSLARMIEFEVYINDQFVLRQRSDGLITATPTGSTAYALSGGGPILYPTLKAFVIVPMFPHTLTSRPIVVDYTSRIEIVVSKNNSIFPKLSFDGQIHFDLAPDDRIEIQKLESELKLIHPKHHDYFAVLREKLGWSTSQIKDL
jgi:NAD+ kinase